MRGSLALLLSLLSITVSTLSPPFPRLKNPHPTSSRQACATQEFEVPEAFAAESSSPQAKLAKLLRFRGAEWEQNMLPHIYRGFWP